MDASVSRLTRLVDVVIAGGKLVLDPALVLIKISQFANGGNGI